jgi:hypothetical protein
VYYNGSLLFTFVIHHTASDGITVLPLFFATDSYSAEIGYISNSSNNGTLSTRSGFNGYNYLYTGGLYVEANSDPTCY